MFPVIHVDERLSSIDEVELHVYTSNNEMAGTLTFGVCPAVCSRFHIRQRVWGFRWITLKLASIAVVGTLRSHVRLI